jgi:hypothetical protein
VLSGLYPDQILRFQAQLSADMAAAPGARPRSWPDRAGAIRWAIRCCRSDRRDGSSPNEVQDGGQRSGGSFRSVLERDPVPQPDPLRHRQLVSIRRDRPAGADQRRLRRPRTTRSRLLGQQRHPRLGQAEPVPVLESPRGQQPAAPAPGCRSR